VRFCIIIDGPNFINRLLELAYLKRIFSMSFLYLNLPEIFEAYSRQRTWNSSYFQVLIFIVQKRILVNSTSRKQINCWISLEKKQALLFTEYH